MSKAKIIIGNLLNSDSHIIVQQLNCLCVRPHGLSQSISNKFYYANVYGKRQGDGRLNLAIKKDYGIPGQIVISGLKENEKNPDNPVVIGLYGQFDYGKPYLRKYRPTHNPPETKELREIWFQEALDNMTSWLIDNKYNNENVRIGFPYGIGCGLAGGNWSHYSKMIDNFADNINCQINIIKLK
jgi:hypothetical protein